MSVVSNDFSEPAFMEKNAADMTQEQLFERIAYKIWRKYNGAISKAEAYEATRNLTEFAKALVKQGQENDVVLP